MGEVRQGPGKYDNKENLVSEDTDEEEEDSYYEEEYLDLNMHGAHEEEKGMRSQSSQQDLETFS